MFHCSFFCFHRKALLKLDPPVTIDGRIQAAQLPNDCRSLKGNEPVTSAGTGRFTIQDSKYNSKILLRHAYFTTLSKRACKKMMNDVNFSEIICVNVVNDRSAYDGDSGIFEIDVCFK